MEDPEFAGAGAEDVGAGGRVLPLVRQEANPLEHAGDEIAGAGRSVCLEDVLENVYGERAG